MKIKSIVLGLTVIYSVNAYSDACLVDVERVGVLANGSLKMRAQISTAPGWVTPVSWGAIEYYDLCNMTNTLTRSVNSKEYTVGPEACMVWYDTLSDSIQSSFQIVIDYPQGTCSEAQVKANSEAFIPGYVMLVKNN